MSFSKAKLTRFNEINDCTPSPAHYNPVSNTRTTGINVDKDPSSDGKGDGSNSVRSGSSTCFKTPTPAKKPSKSTSKSKNDVFEALKEKSIECENKDDVIKQLLDELNNLKDQSGDLQSEKAFVESEVKKFQKELDDINESYSVSLTVLNGCFKKDEEDLTQEIRDLKVLLTQLHEGQDTMRKAFLMKYEETEKTIEGLSKWFFKTIVPKAPDLDAADDMIAERDKDLKLLNEKLNAIKIAREITIANLNKSYTLHIEELKVKMKEKIKEIEEKFFSEKVFDVVFNEEVKNDIYNEGESQIVTTVTDSGIDVQSEDVISIKNNKPNLTMYTETYLNDFKPNKDFTNPFIIITSPNGDHKYKTGLKMKFYPLESIEESDLSSNEDEITSTSTQTESLTDFYKKTCKKRESKLKKRKNKEIKDLKNSQRLELDKIEAEEKLKSEQLAEKIREVIRLAGATPEEVARIVNARYQSIYDEELWEDDSILTECESIGKYTIHQSEIEKSNLQKEVELIKNELIEEQNPNRMEYINLLKNHEEVVNEYKNFQKQQLNTLIEMNDNISEYKNDNNSYKLTINKVHETIEALTKRLFQSDNDVEQLKSELKQTETTTLELNIKKDKLTEELNSLNKQNEDLRLQKESTSKLFQSEMKQFEENILQIIEEYKNNINKVLKDYKIKLETNEYDLQEVIKCLYEQEVLNSEAFNLIHLANVEIEDLDKNNRLFKDQICTIKLELEKSKSQIEQINKSKKEINEKLKYEQLKNTQLQEEILSKISQQDEIESLNKQINQLKEKNKTYEEYCEYYNQKVKDYEKIINEMDDINRSYINQTKNYEDLVLKCEEIEKKNLELRKILIEKDVIFPIEKLNSYNDELKGLITQKNVIEDENKVIGMKYMEILDDKNQMGSVKHIVELKEKNFSLLKENQTMESKIQSQSKTIGKLKAELRTFKKTPKKNGKENESEANKENSFCESYVSPLRDRNRNE